MRLRCALFECCIPRTSDALPEDFIQSKLPNLGYAELVNATHNFHPSKCLGKGILNSKVYHGILQDRREIAIHRFCKHEFHIFQRDVKETAILSLLPHKNLVSVYGYACNGEEYLLAHEYIPNGTLQRHLHGEGTKRIILPWHTRLDIAIDTANALAYLHSNGIVHSQITPYNILLGENFCAKVKDILRSWQLPRDVSGCVTHVSTSRIVGRIGYMDPQYVMDGELSVKSDAYSFGVVLCQLISSKPAYWEDESGKVMSLHAFTISKIQKHELEELLDPSLGFESDPGIKQMLTAVAVLAFQCLNDEADQRPSMGQVLKGLTDIRGKSRDLNSTADLEQDILEMDFFQAYLKSQFIFSHNELAKATNHFENYLGKGGFGSVYYGKLPDGREVAIKRFHEKKDKTIEQFMKEIEILSLLRHQNLVSLYGRSSDHSEELLLVYEYVSNGSLASYLHRNSGNKLPWPTRLNIAIDSACALAYLHHSGIIHRDVKSSNILLDKNFGAKVADFGLARFLPLVASQQDPAFVTHVSTAPVGTPAYIDPEYYEFNKVGDKSDVYSYGVVLFQLISSKSPMVRQGPQAFTLANFAMGKMLNNVLEELVDPSLGFDSDNRIMETIAAVAELAFQCVQCPKEFRPSMKQVLETLEGIKQGTWGFNQIT